MDNIETQNAQLLQNEELNAHEMTSASIDISGLQEQQQII